MDAKNVITSINLLSDEKLLKSHTNNFNSKSKILLLKILIRNKY